MDDSQAISDVARFVREHLDADLSCDTLARRACMGKTKFKQQFKRALGCPPAAYVAEERVSRARMLLETTALPVARIARMVGYRKPGAFSESFRRRTGMLPSEIRIPSEIRRTGL